MVTVRWINIACCGIQVNFRDKETWPALCEEVIVRELHLETKQYGTQADIKVNIYPRCLAYIDSAAAL